MWKKTLSAILAFLLGICLAILFGPRPVAPEIDGILPELTYDLEDLDTILADRESKIENLKPDNEARVVWNDTDKKEITEYSIVYLHGFGASQGEGEPVHREIAREFGCNLYLPRFIHHGIESEEGNKNLTAGEYMDSVKKAVATGELIGEKVILMGTSTGGTFALYLAAENPQIAGVILYSPLVELHSELLHLARGPWGRALISFFEGNPRVIEREDPVSRYWSRVYYPEGVIALSQIVGQTMRPETFRKLRCPVYLGYYYKNKEEQDQVVSISRMMDMWEQLGTSPDMKRKAVFPEAKAHVISSRYRTDAWPDVIESTRQFCEEVIQLKPVSVSNP